MSVATILKRVGIGLGALIALLIVVFLLGPRNDFGPFVPTPREASPNDLTKLDDWLAKQESAYKDILPGAAKGIVWASERKEKTPWAVVNIHGYSASREEGAPVPDLVAKALGANRYETRLTGHGRGNGLPMSESTPQDWLADATEAVRIGRSIGERVLVMGTSTGATLGTWLGIQPENQDIAAFVFISPNYAPRNPQAQIVNWPWGRQITIAVGGETRSWTPTRPGVEKVWAHSYPMKSVFPMMALVKHMQQADLSPLRAPVLMLYSETDQVIDPEQVRKAFARVGSTVKKIEAVTYSDDGNQHNLASAITAPKAVQPLSDAIIQWVKSLPAPTR